MGSLTVEQRRRYARCEALMRRSDLLPPAAAVQFCPRDGQISAAATLGRWAIEPAGGIYLHGGVGVGKTVLAARAAAVLRARGIPVLYLKAKRALDGLRDFQSPGPGGHPSMSRWWRESLSSAEVLILDDLGAHQVTDFALEELVAAFDHRHDFELPTIVTSNFTGPELLDAFGARLADRIRGLCSPVKVEGQSHREAAA